MALRVYSEVVKRAVEQFRDKSALFIRRGESYRSWTYNDFHNDMNRTAEALRGRGFTEQDNAIVIGSNTPEWVIAWHAIFFAGNCTIPVDPNLPADELEEIVMRSSSKVVFCDAAYLPLFDRLRLSTDSPIDTIVVLTGEIPPAYEAVSFETFLAEAENAPSVFDRSFSPEDEIAILFTSGTTGRSKGVVLMQKNYCSTAEYAFDMMGVTSEDRVMAVLPLYHVFGFAATIAGGLMGGVDVVFIPEIKGPLIVQAMNDLQVTALPAVPQMLTLILESIKRGAAEKGAIVKSLFAGLMNVSGAIKPVGGRGVQRKLFKSVHDGFGGKFRLIISGGASLDERSFQAYQALGFDIVEGYGLTETMGPITLCPITDQIQGSVGQVIGTNDVKILDPDTAGWGEVLFRGDSVFQGYLDDPVATAAVFDKDGWFHTGDRGRLDEKGFLFLSGRLKDMIVLDSGKNVYPDELEHYYESSDFIEEVGVFAIQESGRTAVAAVVVPVSHGRSGSEEEYIQKVHNEMVALGANRPDYKRIGTYVVSEQPLPRTSTKKVKKHVLPELYAQIKSGETAPEPVPLTAVQTLLMESELYRSIMEEVQKIAPQSLSLPELTPDRELLRDIGIDSLRLLDLAAALEQKEDISIDEKALTLVVTLEDLVSLVQDSGQSEETLDIKTILEKACEEHKCEFEDRKGAMVTAGLSFVKASTSALWGFRIRGLENIPEDRPVVFAANHESLLDGIWLYASLPGHIRKRTYTMIKAELTKAKFLSKLREGINIIPVEREGDIITPLQLSYAALKHGKNVVIFPEGTRSTDGLIHEFRSGIGILLRETDVEVIPVRLINAAKKWPKGKSLQLFSGWKERPEIVFGKPVTLKHLGFNSSSNEEKIAEAVREEVRKLS